MQGLSHGANDLSRCEKRPLFSWAVDHSGSALFSQQSLQAFVCAVELDAEHSAAWTDLGQLYEIHHQFEDALNCYKQAVKFNPGWFLVWGKSVILVHCVWSRLGLFGHTPVLSYLPSISRI